MSANTPRYDLDTDITLGGDNPSDQAAVSQKAVKYYIDHSSGGIVIDNELSTTSENPVQNRIITGALNNKQDVLTAGTDLEIIKGGDIVDLPEGYTQVEYITTDGTAYIDTGITVADTDTLDFSYTDTSSDTKVMFITGKNGSNGANIYFVSPSSSLVQWNDRPSSFALAKNVEYNIILKSGEFTFTNSFGTTTKTFTGGSVSTTGTCLIGAGRSGNGSIDFRKFIGNISKWQIKDDNNTLRFNGVPCYNSNNLYGLYDTVSQTFFPSIGTSAFTGGDKVVAGTLINFTNASGYTKNVGTVTSVNNIQPDANGNVTIPTGGTVDQTFDGTSANAQSGVAIEGELTTHYVKSSAEDTTQGITSSIGYMNDFAPAMQLNWDNYQFIVGASKGAVLMATDTSSGKNCGIAAVPNGIMIAQDTNKQAILTVTSTNNLMVNGTEIQPQLVSGTNIKTINNNSILGSGNIDIEIPANYVTTNTAQTINAKKTFTGEKAILFKQDKNTDKLGFTLYNPSDTELGAFEYRPNTINGNALLNINTSYSNACYVGFRYWGTAVSIIAPKVATAGNYFIPTHITDGTNTVTASNNGTLNISSLLPTIEAYTATEVETLWESI